MVRVLLAAGADLEHRAGSGGLASFYIACKGGDVGLVQLLLAHGANHNHVGASKYAPIHGACEAGQVAVVEILLQLEGVNVDLPGPLGRTPLWIASERGHLDIVRILVSAGANPKLPDNSSTIYALPIYAAQVSGHGHVVDFLLSVGVVPTNNEPGEKGRKKKKKNKPNCCVLCGKVETSSQKLQKCPCKTVRYCNNECQRTHWKTHKLAHKQAMKSK